MGERTRHRPSSFDYQPRRVGLKADQQAGPRRRSARGRLPAFDAFFMTMASIRPTGLWEHSP